MTRPSQPATPVETVEPTEPTRPIEFFAEPTEPTRPIEFFAQPTEPAHPIELFAQPTPLLAPAFAEPTIEFTPDAYLLDPIDEALEGVEHPGCSPHEGENLTALSPIFHAVTPVEPMSIARSYVEHPTPAPRTEPRPTWADETLAPARPSPFFQETTTEPCIQTVTEPLLDVPPDFQDLLTVETSAPSWTDLEARLNPARVPCASGRPAPIEAKATVARPVSAKPTRLRPSWTPDSKPGLFPLAESTTPKPGRRRSAGQTAPAQIVSVAVATFTLLSASAVFSWILLGSW